MNAINKLTEHEEDADGRPSLAAVQLKGDSALSFFDICVDIQKKRVLWDVSGEVNKGEILAVMGPSGGGKTTLLNALAGYVPTSKGKILVNQRKITKRIRRKISYVLQSDIFFANLTLREILMYSALLRLPSEIKLSDKIRKVDSVIDSLGLQSCKNTIFGSPLKRGLSGGEKKRANIGCELLTDPYILLLDEPTSGLDSSSAFSLFSTLKDLAHQSGKTVITSIHQPSSQLFYSFDKLILLAKGKVAYYGPARDVLEQFSSVGLTCALHYNPGDFIIEMVSDPQSRRILIGPDPPEQKPHVPKKWWQRIWPLSKLTAYRRHHHHEEELGSQPNGTVVNEEAPSIILPSPPNGTLLNEEAPTIITVPSPEPSSVPEESALGEEALETEGNSSGSSDETGSYSLEDSDVRQDNRKISHVAFDKRKWMTPWYWQFLVLVHRSFKLSWHQIITKLKIFQITCVLLASCLVWFQVPYVESSIQDRYGLLFFSLTFWSFNTLIGAAGSFPNDEVVIAKERSAGSYHLSAYYLAKMISEDPLNLSLPTIYISVLFPVAGLFGWGSFFGTLLTLLIACWSSASIGYMFGAIFLNIQKAFVLGVVLMLSFMLFGGFFVQTLPFWLRWGGYISVVTYGFDALLQLNFGSETQFLCNSGPSDYAICSTNSTHIPGPDVLKSLAVENHLAFNILIQILFGLVFRLLGYLALRFLHKNKGPQ